MSLRFWRCIAPIMCADVQRCLKPSQTMTMTMLNSWNLTWIGCRYYAQSVVDDLPSVADHCGQLTVGLGPLGPLGWLGATYICYVTASSRLHEWSWRTWYSFTAPHAAEASGLCKESGFTLFSIPMGMELLDFLAAQAEVQSWNNGHAATISSECRWG